MATSEPSVPLSTRAKEVQDAHDVLNKNLIKPGVGNEQVLQAYEELGNRYEKLMETLEYSAPKKMAEAAASILGDNFNARILDVGAGSGYGGIELKARGYTNLEAVEPVKHLVDIALERKIYNKMLCQPVGNSHKLPYKDGEFDMVVMAGVLGNNHLPLSAFDEIMRVIRSGGHLVNVHREEICSRPWYINEFDVYFKELEKEGKWKEIDRKTFPEFLAGIDGIIINHQIL